MKNLIGFFHNLLVPHENNNFRARSLHTDFLGLYLIIALVLSFSFKQIGLSSVLGFATDISTDKLLQLTNQKRADNGLGPLLYNDKLSQAAALKAQDMFANNYWAHYSPSGTTPWEFIVKSGYQYEYAGENLAKNFLFSDGVVDAWMKSPTHRDNLLKNEYSEVGFAVVNGTLNGEQTTLVVQMFAKPSTIQVAQKPTTNNLPEVKEVSEPEKIAEQPIKTPIQSESVVLAKATSQPVSLPAITFNMNLVFFSFLLLALGLDFYFAAKFNIIRVGGKNIAHFVFVFFMIIALFIAKRGSII